MTWPYHYTPYIWPMLASFALMSALATYAWQRRATPGAIAFVSLMLTVGLWALGKALEITAADYPVQFFWFKFHSALHLPAAVAALSFCLEYSGLGRWVTRRSVALLLAPAVPTLPLLFMDDVSFVWTRLMFDDQFSGEFAPFGLAISLYGMALLLLASVVIIVLFVRSPLHRVPAALILLGQLGPRVAYPLDTLNLVSASQLDLSVLGFDFACLMYTIALFRFRLFDVVPVAREVVLERMEDGMLVLDARNRVADLNPSAQGILDAPRSRVLGKDATLALEAFPDLARLVRTPGTGQIEVTLGKRVAQRCYQISCSSLADRRGFALGRLIIMHDVTSLKDARERLLQRERALAMLQERERVARELHDGIGQVLGYVSLQVEATRKLLEDGKGAVADKQLARLAAVSRDAHADVREHILDLRAASSEQQPFFVTVGRYLDGFAQNFNIHTNLAISPGLADESFGPEVQAQVFRIIQEAMSNARRHGDARSVQVSFETKETLARVVIQDDGRGFDLAAVSSGQGGGFGLQFMRERAEGLGGCLVVLASPGCGTMVAVEVPLDRLRED